MCLFWARWGGRDWEEIIAGESEVSGYVVLSLKIDSGNECVTGDIGYRMATDPTQAAQACSLPVPLSDRKVTHV
ncbi:hypothetical protein GCM10027031_17070 [Corynebacterium atrinae]